MICAVTSVLVVTFPVALQAQTATDTITFDDTVGQDRVLNGQYPNGVIDWGTNAWYLSAPWRQFTTKSIGFNGPGPTDRRILVCRAAHPVASRRFQRWHGRLHGDARMYRSDDADRHGPTSTA